jgi:hypothetical protein
VVAFLQNSYVGSPRQAARWKFLLERGGLYERHYQISYGLFAGCKTGQVLLRAGFPRFPAVAWDNITTQIGTHSRSIFPPEPEHIVRVINEYDPELVVVLGEPARRAMELIDFSGRLLYGPHPAARMNVMTDLKPIAEEVKKLCGR